MYIGNVSPHWVAKGHSKMQYALIHKVRIYDIDFWK